MLRSSLDLRFLTAAGFKLASEWTFERDAREGLVTWTSLNWFSVGFRWAARSILLVDSELCLCFETPRDLTAVKWSFFLLRIFVRSSGFEPYSEAWSRVILVSKSLRLGGIDGLWLPLIRTFKVLLLGLFIIPTDFL